MKRILVLLIVMITIILTQGCDFSNRAGEESALTENVAKEIMVQAANKFYYVADHGASLPGSEAVDREIIEIDNEWYIPFWDALDTEEELLAYLEGTFTSSSILRIKKTLGIIEYEGALYEYYADRGSTEFWGDATVISIEQNGQDAEVLFDVPFLWIEEPASHEYTITFLKGPEGEWLLEIEDLWILY